MYTYIQTYIHSFIHSVGLEGLIRRIRMCAPVAPLPCAQMSVVWKRSPPPADRCKPTDQCEAQDCTTASSHPPEKGESIQT